jgi:hypothetical protein
VELATILVLYPMFHKFLATVMPAQIAKKTFFQQHYEFSTMRYFMIQTADWSTPRRQNCT